MIAAQQVQPQGSVLLGHSVNGVEVLRLSMANRHGIVAGATGTGKTVTLMTLAQGLVESGVAVFAPDVKGDLSVINRQLPTRFYDLSGESGHRISVSIRDIGSTLFSRLVEASEAQERVITILFAVARDYRLALDTVRDVRAAFRWMEQNVEVVARDYGGVPPQAVQVITGKLLMLQESGADRFFGPTNFSIAALVGSGMNILRASNLISNPSLYSTFLFWMLSELFTKLPEVGDVNKPKMVFFFDEAHLLFADAPKHFVQKVEQVVRLIRSKGVGVYFVTQSPADIPDAILAQLGNRIQHRLSAYTPNEQKGLRAAAGSFRANPEFSTLDAIQTLGRGEALVSFLDEEGVPSIVQRTKITMRGSGRGPAEVVTLPQREPVPQPVVTDHVENVVYMETTPQWARKKRRDRRMNFALVPLFTITAVGSWIALGAPLFS